MRYTSNKIISFAVMIEGTNKRIRFIPKMQGGSIYVTDDVREIEALEASNMYGRVYKRAPGCENEEVLKKNAGVKVNTPKLKNVKTVSTWQEAVEYLSTKCGSEAEKLTTPEAIANEAVEKGVSFVNLK